MPFSFAILAKRSPTGSFCLKILILSSKKNIPKTFTRWYLFLIVVKSLCKLESTSHIISKDICNLHFISLLIKCNNIALMKYYLYLNFIIAQYLSSIKYAYYKYIYIMLFILLKKIIFKKHQFLINMKLWINSWRPQRESNPCFRREGRRPRPLDDGD